MATPNFSLYGPTPSAASVQQRDWSGYYSDQNNVNERNRVSAILASIQLQEQQDRTDEQSRQFDQARNIDFSRYAHRLSEGRRGEAEDLRRFNVDIGLRRDAATEGKRRFNAEADLKLLDMATKPDAVAARTQENDIKRLQQMADLGEINDERHVLALSPTTPVPLAKQLATTSASIRREIEAGDAQVKAAIDTVNKFENLNQELRQQTAKESNTLGDWAHAGTPNADRKAKLDALQKELATIGPAYQQIVNPKHPLYEDVQTYRNTGIPPRPWQRGRSQAAAAPSVNFQNFATTTATSTAPTATASRQYPPAFYDRVNQLIDSGVEPRAAKARAIAELSQ